MSAAATRLARVLDGAEEVPEAPQQDARMDEVRRPREPPRGLLAAAETRVPRGRGARPERGAAGRR